VPGENDLTEAVIKQINVGAPVDAPKPEDKPAPKSGSK